MDDKRRHYEEILLTAQQHAAVRDRITERAGHYSEHPPILHPPILRPDGR
jgi:hypothetical protein